MGVEQAGGRSARRTAGGAVCGGPGIDVPEGQPGSPGLPGHPGAAPGAVLLWLAGVGSAYRGFPGIRDAAAVPHFRRCASYSMCLPRPQEPSNSHNRCPSRLFPRARSDAC